MKARPSGCKQMVATEGSTRIAYKHRYGTKQLLADSPAASIKMNVKNAPKNYEGLLRFARKIVVFGYVFIQYYI